MAFTVSYSNVLEYWSLSDWGCIPGAQRSVNIGMRSVKPVVSCWRAADLVIDSGGMSVVAVADAFNDVSLLP